MEDRSVPTFVIDTNVFLDDLPIIQGLSALAPSMRLKLIIPVQVIQELQGLAKSKGAAKRANRWLFYELAENTPHLVRQKVLERTQQGLVGDASILDCCRYFHEHRNAFTVLLSNDKNLCCKALVHGVKTISIGSDLTAGRIAEVVCYYSSEKAEPYVDNHTAQIQIYEDHDMELMNVEMEDVRTVTKQLDLSIWSSRPNHIDESGSKDIDQICRTILSHVIDLIDVHMRNSLGAEDIKYFEYSKPDPTRGVEPILGIIKRYGFSVFSDVLPRELLDKLCKPKGYIPRLGDDIDKFINYWGDVWAALSMGVGDIATVRNEIAYLKDGIWSSRPNHIDESGSKDIDQICRTILSHVIDLIDVHMRNSLGAEDIKYFEYSKPDPTRGVEPILGVIKRYRFSVFSDVLPRELLYKLCKPKGYIPRLGDDIDKFINYWGDVWEALSMGVGDIAAVRKEIAYLKDGAAQRANSRRNVET
jgi:rRNA-processing protein FCF1